MKLYEYKASPLSHPENDPESTSPPSDVLIVK